MVWWEKRLLDKVFVVFLQKLLGGLLGLHGGKSVSLGFKAANNISDDSSLYGHHEEDMDGQHQED